MAITGGIIVIIAFAAIIKKYEARMVLFAAGLLMCIIGGVAGNAITTFSKTMVHGTLVPVICTVMGFSFVMKLTECDRHLVESISGVITKTRAILIPLAVLLTWWINIAIPSAAGCAAAVGSILIPALIAAGVHPAMAAAAVLAGTWGSAISPGTSHNPFVADLAGTDVMTVIMNEAPAAIIASFVCIIALTAIAIICKEGPTEERRNSYLAQLTEGEQNANFKVNPIYALIPLVPLIMLVLGSKQIAVLPLTDVPTAMITGSILALIATRKNPQEVTKKFFDGMGSAYGSVMGLIIAAAVFTAGMAAMGLTGALIEAMKGSESIAKFAGAFGPFLIAVISGSGDAAALAFNGAITPQAEAFGMSIVDLGSLAQMAGAMGRSMSPVAGAAMVCAGLAKVSPMEISKRNALPMLLATITFMIVLFI
ncbi:C4-dicarboxylate transporter DcuC [Selenomonas sp. TAMA-11512]|uniref:C4-dicarboxylate transporter DcuC n=1 Tax=Selenomonas sp. TAMA-11512 TaxID=3095337 RepID=UPI003091EC28|nr:C4-dicarboxylate transporter DcuC [Selenomonas sp. TAMA-11512]